MHQIQGEFKKIYWNLWNESDLELEKGGFISISSNVENQPIKTFHIPQIQKKNKTTW